MIVRPMEQEQLLWHQEVNPISLHPKLADMLTYLSGKFLKLNLIQMLRNLMKI